MITVIDKITGEPLNPQPELSDGLWVEEKIGEMVRRYEYHEPVNTSTPEPIEIFIDDIQGVVQKSSDNTKVTCYELTDATITGRLNIPDQTFAAPIRRDDGRLFLFPAQVINGEFSVVINFPTTGQFTYSDNECNIDLPYPMFTVKTLKIDCLRNVSV